MKRTALSLLIALCVATAAPAIVMAAGSPTEASAAKEKKDKEAAVKFKKKTHDFGNIKEADGKVTCSFQFTNTGTAPLVIISATAGCGCTRPSFDEKPIAPGKSSEIRVSFNPENRPGEFNKNITVKTNAHGAKKVVLKITGAVIPED